MTGLVYSPDLLSAWEIDPIHSVHVLPQGESAPAGNVAFVETATGARYVLKRKTIQRTWLHEYRLLEFLVSQGVPVAVPLRARTGEPFARVGEDCYELSPRLPGSVYTDHYAPGAADRAGQFGAADRAGQFGAADRARQFGAAIARLHASLCNWDQVACEPDMDLPGEIARGGLAVRQAWPAGQIPLEPILSDLESGLSAGYALLPKQLIHRDAHPGNMLFQDGRLSGWLDFEIAQRGPRLFDLAYCSTSLLMNGLDDPAKRQAWFGLVTALEAGYESVNPLTPVERRSLRLVQMSIEVIFIAYYAGIQHSAGMAQNINALVWLYENPYEL